MFEIIQKLGYKNWYSKTKIRDLSFDTQLHFSSASRFICITWNRKLQLYVQSSKFYSNLC